MACIVLGAGRAYARQRIGQTPPALPSARWCPPPCQMSTQQPPQRDRTRGHDPRPVTLTRGAGSLTAALAMVFKLVESAQQRWRAVNAPHLVALVLAGARFERGQLIERPTTVAA